MLRLHYSDCERSGILPYRCSRHVQATLQDALPPMAYATYSTMVAEVERRLCSEVEFLRKQLGDKAGSSGSVLRVSEKVQAPLQPAAASVIRVMDTGGAIEVVEQRPGVQYVEERVHTVVEDNTEVTIQTLIATLNGRNKVIRQLQDSLAATAGVDNPAASDTILMLATQLEERETTLAQLKVSLNLFRKSILFAEEKLNPVPSGEREGARAISVPSIPTANLATEVGWCCVVLEASSNGREK